MLRIICIEPGMQGSVATLKLEGRLIGPWVRELQRTCEEIDMPPGGIDLDLSDVSFVDAAGVELLSGLIRRGATIRGCTGFIAELLGLGHRETLENSTGDNPCVL